MNNPFETIEARLSNIENLLLDLKHSSQEGNVQTETDELLTVEGAAKLLILSVPTVYGLVSKNEIPVSKKGKRLYFSKQELTDWIKTGRRRTSAEIEIQAKTFLNRKAK